MNISGDARMTLQEVNEAAKVVYQATNGQADVRMGAARPRDLKDGMKVTLIATGLNEPLPEVADISDLLSSTELFPATKRTFDENGQLVINRSDLEIPAFLRKNMD